VGECLERRASSSTIVVTNPGHEEYKVCRLLFQSNTNPPNSTLIKVFLSSWLVESVMLVLGWNKTLYALVFQEQGEGPLVYRGV
jgi:hypothetical protein